jgi:hypothetical protein
MSLATVRTKIDDWLTPRWATLVDRQDTFFTARGKYFQGKWTHSAEVQQTDALNGDTIPNALTGSPTDQPQHWRDFIGTAFDALPLPARLRIDVYNGPLGQGWVATLQVRYDGKVYERSRNVGPETWRTEAWRLLSQG